MALHLWDLVLWDTGASSEGSGNSRGVAAVGALVALGVAERASSKGLEVSVTSEEVARALRDAALHFHDLEEIYQVCSRRTRERKWGRGVVMSRCNLNSEPRHPPVPVSLAFFEH